MTGPLAGMQHCRCCGSPATFQRCNSGHQESTRETHAGERELDCGRPQQNRPHHWRCSHRPLPQQRGSHLYIARQCTRCQPCDRCGWLTPLPGNHQTILNHVTLAQCRCVIPIVSKLLHVGGLLLLCRLWQAINYGCRAHCGQHQQPRKRRQRGGDGDCEAGQITAQREGHSIGGTNLCDQPFTTAEEDCAPAAAVKFQGPTKDRCTS